MSRRSLKLALTAITVGVALLIGAQSAGAQYTDTLPKHTFMIDVAHSHAWLKHRYDDNGKKVTLLEPLHRYEPGGGLQGIVIPNALATYDVSVVQLRYGITDYLTAVIGVPIVARTVVDPRMGWIPGDYQWPMGRTYTQEDFWLWAASMGQPKPTRWVGNKGVVSDIIFAMRYRFSDHFPAFKRKGWGLALQAYYAAPTGRQKDPELLAASGTTSFELHFQGDLGVHIGLSKSFLNKRLSIGFDFFYEAMLPQKYQAATGSINPLIQTFAPYTGDTYVVDGGDFYGAAFTFRAVLWKGPAIGSWLVKGDKKAAERLPPILTVEIEYKFTGLTQSDWRSDSEIWDWTQEKLWLPGYKNSLSFQLVISLLRVGAPFQIYARYRNLSWIPGKNSRAADVFAAGIRIPLKFW